MRADADRSPPDARSQHEPSPTGFLETQEGPDDGHHDFRRANRTADLHLWRRHPTRLVIARTFLPARPGERPTERRRLRIAPDWNARRRTPGSCWRSQIACTFDRLVTLLDDVPKGDALKGVEFQNEPG